jgi:hypothetical protein
MVSLVQLWLPILLSAVGVFVASAILHMVLRFWHGPDYRRFSNQDDIQAAIRKGGTGGGMYMVPYCGPEEMKKPELAEKFKTGPIGLVFLREGGMSVGRAMFQWFVLCLVMALFVGYVAAIVFSGGDTANLFRVTATIAFVGFGFGPLAAAVWDNLPWKVAFKRVVDALIYGAVTGAIFAWLWPSA